MNCGSFSMHKRPDMSLIQAISQKSEKYCVFNNKTKSPLPSYNTMHCLYIFIILSLHLKKGKLLCTQLNI